MGLTGLRLIELQVAEVAATLRPDARGGGCR